MKRNVQYSVPEGYLENLGSSISSSVRPASRGLVWKALPLATALAAVTMALYLNFGRHGNAAEHDEEEELIEYLIESGTTLAQIENFNENY